MLKPGTPPHASTRLGCALRCDSWRRRLRKSLVAVGLASIGGACTPSAPPMPSVSGPVLSSDEQREMLQAMRDVVPDDFVPLSIRREIRPANWADIPAVVATVAARHEMAILEREIGDDEMRFTLRTLNDRIGTITVRRGCDRADGVEPGGARGSDEELTIAASIGRFGADADLEASLVGSIEKVMRTGVRGTTVADRIVDPPMP